MVLLLTMLSSTLGGRYIRSLALSLTSASVIVATGDHLIRCLPTISLCSCSVLFSSVLFSSVLFCSVLFCSVQFCSVLFCSVLFCSVLFCSVLFCSVLFSSVLFCSVLFSSVLFCSLLFSSIQLGQQFLANLAKSQEICLNSWLLGLPGLPVCWLVEHEIGCPRYPGVRREDGMEKKRGEQTCRTGHGGI
jgi:hypothetical protein